MCENLELLRAPKLPENGNLSIPMIEVQYFLHFLYDPVSLEYKNLVLLRDQG